jgi:hypothetical protein
MLKTYKQGSFISEREFATNLTFDYSGKSSKFINILYITKEDFFKALKENNEDLEKICTTRENLIFNESFKTFG